jgi:NAD+-dependent farnesol dehydrogenase
MRVLITGATGYLGRTLVAAFRNAGHETVAFSRHATASGLDGEARDGDVRDTSALAAAAAGCDAICHSAGLVSVWRRRRADFDEVNVGGLENVLAVAEAAGITRILYTSSFLALPPTGATVPGRWNDYQRTKVVADERASDAVARGVPLIRVYPGVIYGPGSMTAGNLVGSMIRDHLAGRLPGLIGADCLWSFALATDVARGHVAALERGTPGARYYLGGENAPQMQAFEIVRDLTGRPLPRRIPAWAGVAIGAVEELRAALTGRAPLLTAGTVEVLTRHWAMDSRVAMAELGYHVTPLRDGIKQVVANLGPPGPRQAAGGTA